MRRSETFWLVVASVLFALSVSGCAPGDDPSDGENDSFVGDKADGFCVEEGTPEAAGVLRLVNDRTVDAAELDDEAGLASDPARNIVAARPIADLAALDAVPFVGPIACQKLKSYARTKGFIGGAPLACQLDDRSGGQSDLGALADPVARLVLQGEGCPTSYAQVQAKLRQTDKTNCEGERDGLKAMMISEQAQITGQSEPGRHVITRTCADRSDHEMFFSLLGLSADSGELPEDAEIMGFDSVRGVYNYYTVEGGEWAFHGSSLDLIEPGATSRCAACHTGGGPIMKELDTPWLHWEGHEDTPGTGAIVDKFADLGSKSDGADLESIVKDGNTKWNAARIRRNRDSGTVADLLRPLFCTVEINLDNGADFRSPPSGSVGSGDDLSEIPADFLFDPRLKDFGGIEMSASTYRTAILDAGQKVVDGSGRQLKDNRGTPAVDTIFDFVFPERSFADNDYIDQLIGKDIITEHFAKDVLMVDFTTPIFSDARCQLLEFAPELAPADRTPARIRDGFIANLGGAAGGGAAAQLLANLNNDNDGSAHEAAIEAFLTACGARAKTAMMADVMKLVSLRRNQARDLPVLEFAETMPTDNLSTSASARLNPTTCTLE